MTVHISYVSDVLCVWAYVAEVRLDEVRKEFGESVELEYRFIPVFGATHHRIAEGRKDRGGYAGFGQHVRKVAETDRVRLQAALLAIAAEGAPESMLGQGFVPSGDWNPPELGQ